ncbi:MAG: hypothetical protein ACRDPH_01340 [Marmoricola sp.]
MTEAPGQGGADVGQPAPDTTAAEQQRTGHDGVDRVLDSLDGLEHRPIDDHVGVFEQAHGELRRALGEH